MLSASPASNDQSRGSGGVDLADGGDDTLTFFFTIFFVLVALLAYLHFRQLYKQYQVRRKLELASRNEEIGRAHV